MRGDAGSHGRKGGAYGLECSADAAPVRLVEIRLRDCRKRFRDHVDRVVDEDVDARARGKERADTLGVGDVERSNLDFVTVRGELARKLLEPVAIATVENDVRACFRQRNGHRATEMACRARDERNAAIKTEKLGRLAR